MFSRETVEGYRPPTLAGHRDSVVRVFLVEGTALDVDMTPTPRATLTQPPGALLSVSRDGALFHWVFDPGTWLQPCYWSTRSAYLCRNQRFQSHILGGAPISYTNKTGAMFRYNGNAVQLNEELLISAVFQSVDHAFCARFRRLCSSSKAADLRFRDVIF